MECSQHPANLGSNSKSQPDSSDVGEGRGCSPAVAIGGSEKSFEKSSNNECNHAPCDENGTHATISQLDVVLNNDPLMDNHASIENELVVDPLKPSSFVRTIGRNVDRRIGEVLCNLGVS